MNNIIKIKIYNSFVLSFEEQKILFLLYQSILGIIPINVYCTLYYLIKKEQKNYIILPNFSFLTTILRINKVNIQKTLYKLEAVNLLTTYQNEEHLLFFLNKPLSFENFIENSVLNNFLLSEMPKKDYEKLIELFIIEKKTTNYKNISKTFDEVFKIKQINIATQKENLKKTIQEAPLINNKNFDYEKFVNKLPFFLQKPFLFKEKNIIKIKHLSFLYKLNYEDMSLALEKAVVNNEINLFRLNYQAKQIYFSKHPQTELLFISNTENNEKIQDQEFIKELKEHHPADLISKFLVHQKQSKAVALENLSNFLERFPEVETGLLNVLIAYNMKKLEGILPHVNYLEKVFLDWQKKNIIKTEDAYQIFINNQNSSFNANKNIFKKKANNKKPLTWSAKFLKKIREREEKRKNDFDSED